MVRSIPKCDKCRTDKKKCNRQRGEKCERCEKEGFRCSDYRTTEAEKRLPSPMPSTIGENPLFQQCLLLLSYHRMLFHVESVATNIYATIRAGNYGSYAQSQLPKVILEIKGSSYEIVQRLWRSTSEISRMNNVSGRIELSSAIQARIEAHPSRQRFEQSLHQLHRITAAAIGTESRHLYDVEHSLADIEREVENIINAPILYSKEERNGQFAKIFIRSLESLGKRFSPILDDKLTLPVPFVHDLWYQHVGERNAFFNDEVKEPTPPMLCHDSLRRTPLHFAVEKMLFDLDPSFLRPRFLAETEMWRLLKNHNPSWPIDAQDAFGRTALHVACCDHRNNGKFSIQSYIIHMLLDNGAKIDIIDEYGKRAIDYAIIYHNTSVLDIFKGKRGLNLDSVHLAMRQVESAMNSALDASRIACQRPGNEIEMDTMDE